MLSHQGRNIFWASEWAIIFPMRALPSIAILEVFYQAGQGKARLKCQLKCFWRLKCRQGLKPRLDPGQTGGQKKKVWKFSINYSSRTFMKRLVLIWAGMTSLPPNTTYNPSHSATATSDMRGQAGTEREPARLSSVKLSQNINWPTDCTASASAELHWTTTGDS